MLGVLGLQEVLRVHEGFDIAPPFFELGPKAYLYGKGVLELAKAADQIGKRYSVRIIFTPQYVDIPLVVRETGHIHVFAQHMDSIRIGRGIGSVLPESLKEAGAVGVLLNHAEKRLSLSEINRTIKRADEVGLATLVCADTPEEAAAIAHLNPNIILAEPPDLIGSSQSGVSGRNYVATINELVRSINPRLRVLHGAGISGPQDVFDIVSMGAEATGCTSAVVTAEDPAAMLEAMIRAMREAWDKSHP
jgi:triosephosphate isomerase